VVSALTNKTFPIFVYGTLRPGCTLWSWLAPSTDGKARVAYLPGHRLYEARGGGYPYLVPAERTYPTQPVVRGTLVHVFNTQDFNDIWNMELKAGYEVRTVDLLGGNPDTNTFHNVGQAMAFVMPQEKYYIWGQGTLIMPEPGVAKGRLVSDWKAYSERQRNLLPGVEEIETIPRNTIAKNT
jgi:gamma-glutamylcyclotransferase (GGCT)/AIG2-like uncharacterized protein YtfP